jgi:hypothetical protein
MQSAPHRAGRSYYLFESFVSKMIRKFNNSRRATVLTKQINVNLANSRELESNASNAMTQSDVDGVADMLMNM